jgi:hypothetical protein
VPAIVIYLYDWILVFFIAYHLSEQAVYSNNGKYLSGFICAFPCKISSIFVLETPIPTLVKFLVDYHHREFDFHNNHFIYNTVSA